MEFSLSNNRRNKDLKGGDKMGIETIKAYVDWCKENNLKPSHVDNVFKYKNKK